MLRYVRINTMHSIKKYFLSKVVTRLHSSLIIDHKETKDLTYKPRNTGHNRVIATISPTKQ